MSDAVIAKLVRMLSSDQDGEVVNAVRMIGKRLKGYGRDWHDVAKALDNVLAGTSPPRSSSTPKSGGFTSGAYRQSEDHGRGFHDFDFKKAAEAHAEQMRKAAGNFKDAAEGFTRAGKAAGEAFGRFAQGGWQTGETFDPDQLLYDMVNSLNHEDVKRRMKPNERGFISGMAKLVDEDKPLSRKQTEWIEGLYRKYLQFRKW